MTKKNNYTTNAYNYLAIKLMSKQKMHNSLITYNNILIKYNKNIIYLLYQNLVLAT